MAIPGITYRLEKQAALTHEEMDNNFRSVIYSGSIHDGGDTLHLHFDTAVEDKVVVPLNGGTGGLTITGNTDNRIVTATGTPGLLQGESNFTFDGDVLTIIGRVELDDNEKNIFIGGEAGDSITGAQYNLAVGFAAGKNLAGNENTALGVASLENAQQSARTVAIGHGSLNSLTTGNSNVSIGAGAGSNLTSGEGNTHLGSFAGPASATAESNKLYINNQASDTPLILGDFSTQQIEFSGGVTGSSFTGSFTGDGSGLTGLTVTQEWDGTRDGDAEITGSLIVSGSSVVVDLTDTLAVSGSIFSGSFVGDGSGLTGVQAETFPYTGSAIISGSLLVEDSTILSGSAEVSGSFTVQGPSDLNGIATVDTNIKIHNSNYSSTIGIGYETLENSNTSAVAVGYQAGKNAGGQQITAIGAQALQSGSCQSIGIGYRAGRLNTGLNTIAIGSFTLANSSTNPGSNNIALGSYALTITEEGSNNTALGHRALQTNCFGKYNTAVGACALRNARSQSDNITDYNVGIGSNAGGNLRDGKQNIYIGYCAGPATPNTDQSNKLYINNTSGDPLIGGDFNNNSVTISGSLLVSQSVVANNFIGDGSGLTNITPTDTVYGIGSGINSIKPVSASFNATVSGDFSIVGGGQDNTVGTCYSLIAGGRCNVIGSAANDSTIGGGRENCATGCLSTTGGGYLNIACEMATTIGGGRENEAKACYSTIGGGSFNLTSGTYSTIEGGNANTITGDISVIGGGQANVISQPYSGILGGNKNNVAHQYSFIVGTDISTTKACTTYVNNLFVTGSTTGNAIMQLSRRETTPASPEEGMIIASGSAGASKVYYYDGSSWNALF